MILEVLSFFFHTIEKIAIFVPEVNFYRNKLSQSYK